MFNETFMHTQSQKPHPPIRYLVVKGDEKERFESWRDLTNECSHWEGVSDILNAMFNSDYAWGNITKDVSVFSFNYDNIEQALNECGWTVRKVV